MMAVLINLLLTVFEQGNCAISHQLQGVPLYTRESKVLLSHNLVSPEHGTFRHPLPSLLQHSAVLVYHAVILFGYCIIFKTRNKLITIINWILLNLKRNFCSYKFFSCTKSVANPDLKTRGGGGWASVWSKNKGGAPGPPAHIYHLSTHRDHSI